jgi:hypothetical protein
VIDHPARYRIAFQRVLPNLHVGPELSQARAAAFARLEQRVRSVADAGLLASTSIQEACVMFNAMCEGLANAELRGAVLPILPVGDEKTAWRRSLATLVDGFANRRHPDDRNARTRTR